jgi:8-oxo-dGTP diphosphatase
MEIKFTLCFIRHQEKYLMLFRQKQPNQFRWNGVGGKIESGESPTNACLREIKEETGLEVTDVSFRGIVTWNDVTWNNPGGMYVFIAESKSGNVVSSDEGSLSWKTLDWIYKDESVVSNIPMFLPAMLRDSSDPMEHAFTYSEEEEILNYEVKDLQDQYLEQVHESGQRR